MALILEAIRHQDVPGYIAVIFRRNSVQLEGADGIWPQAVNLLAPAGIRFRSSPVHEFIFPSRARVQFGHLADENTVFAWQGKQIAMLGFDELTHFTESQFFYMLSRNRSTSGVRPICRATTNPDASSWVSRFIAWWIDPLTGYPIKERAGKLRWFIRDKGTDELVWADHPGPLIAQDSNAIPMSVTFVQALLIDNPTLDKGDPTYRAKLGAMSLVERERLLEGNWKIMPSAGMFFQRGWCGEMLNAAPAYLNRVRFWDLASTEQRGNNDPDWTVGVKLGKAADGLYYVEDVVRGRWGPGDVEANIVSTASVDGKSCRIGIPKDPGAGGKITAAYLIKQLSGYTVYAYAPPRASGPNLGAKAEAFGPFSSQAQAGNVKILRAPWNEVFLATLEGFPEAAHDDDVDACSGAMHMHTTTFQGAVVPPIIARSPRAGHFDNRF